MGCINLNLNMMRNDEPTHPMRFANISLNFKREHQL